MKEYNHDEDTLLEACGFSVEEFTAVEAQAAKIADDSSSGSEWVEAMELEILGGGKANNPVMLRAMLARLALLAPEAE